MSAFAAVLGTQLVRPSEVDGYPFPDDTRSQCVYSRPAIARYDRDFSAYKTVGDMVNLVDTCIYEDVGSLSSALASTPPALLRLYNVLSGIESYKFFATEYGTLLVLHDKLIVCELPQIPYTGSIHKLSNSRYSGRSSGDLVGDHIISIDSTD